jgi:hypothetical protein
VNTVSAVNESSVSRLAVLLRVKCDGVQKLVERIHFWFLSIQEVPFEIIEFPCHSTCKTSEVERALLNNPRLSHSGYKKLVQGVFQLSTETEIRTVLNAVRVRT